MIRDLLLGVSTATVAGVATLVGTGPIFGTAEPAWLAESVIGGVVAAVWMVAGMLVVRSHHVLVGVVVYLLGVGGAWFLTRGVVHSTSAVYGLVPLSVACTSGAIAWLLFRRRGAGRLEMKIAVLVPLSLAMAGALGAVSFAPVGVTRKVSIPEAASRWLPVVVSSESSDTYVWSPRHLDLAGDTNFIHIELDPGSGSSRFVISELRQASDIGRACRTFQEQRASLIENEIRHGYLPAIAKRMPVRYRSCHQGRLWIARPDVA